MPGMKSQQVSLNSNQRILEKVNRRRHMVLTGMPNDLNCGNEQPLQVSAQSSADDVTARWNIQPDDAAAAAQTPKSSVIDTDVVSTGCACQRCRMYAHVLPTAFLPHARTRSASLRKHGRALHLRQLLRYLFVDRLPVDKTRKMYD